MNRAAPWIVALLISVLANGLMAGFVLHRTAGGPDWRGHPGHERQGGPPPGYARGGSAGFNMRAFLEALPEEARAEARDRMQAQREIYGDRMRAAMRARREAEIALTADPYDPDAAAAALSRVRETRIAIEADVEAMVLEIVAGLSPDDRRAALEAGRRGGSDGPRRRRDRD